MDSNHPNETYGYGDLFEVVTEDPIGSTSYRGMVGTIVSVDWSERWHVVTLRFDGIEGDVKFLRSELKRVTPELKRDAAGDRD